MNMETVSPMSLRWTAGQASCPCTTPSSACRTTSAAMSPSDAIRWRRNRDTLLETTLAGGGPDSTNRRGVALRLRMLVQPMPPHALNEFFEQRCCITVEHPTSHLHPFIVSCAVDARPAPGRCAWKGTLRAAPCSREYQIGDATIA